MTKKEDSNLLLAATAVVGGVGAFFFLFTDIGREMLDKAGLIPKYRKPTLADVVHDDPYAFYPFSPDDTKTERSPYVLYDQPYVYTGRPDIPYAHPAAVDKLYEPLEREPNIFTDWIDRMFDYLGLDKWWI